MTVHTAGMENAGVVLGASVERPGSNWGSLYRAGGVAALTLVLIALTDTFIMFIPASGSTPGTLSVIDWFTLYRDSWFLGLRNLGFLNMLTTSLSVPLYLALYATHRRVNQAQAALAVILLCMGATIYIANNTAFPMLTLSGRYAAATTDAQRSLIEAAGAATLAREDLTAGAFLGFFFVEVAGILMSVIMLRGRVFGRATALAGLAGEACLLIFNVCAAFVPAFYDAAMVLGVGGGLLSMAWFILIARRLFQMK